MCHESSSWVSFSVLYPEATESEADLIWLRCSMCYLRAECVCVWVCVFMCSPSASLFLFIPDPLDLLRASGIFSAKRRLSPEQKRARHHHGCTLPAECSSARVSVFRANFNVNRTTINISHIHKRTPGPSHHTQNVSIRKNLILAVVVYT